VKQDEPGMQWVFCLYISGMTLAARRAKTNITALCEEYLEGNYSLEVVDLLESPALAEKHQIFAVPTLVRRLPLPVRKIIGDLSESEKVRVGLDLRTAEPR
jgi:circadian clock protein KaiB